MRLHTLTVQAFGPFPGTETVDFDALSSSGLFLIHGPTGAGKTSVLDAVCFSLYGRVPGAREAAKSPRSLHAPPTREPMVTLDATLAGRRLRIEREPAWERPKRRGEGTTTQKAKVVVTELVDGEWQGRATRPDEAGQFLGDLIGLSLDQFCQMALLPQGDFARFLRAEAKERRVALERIFGTEVFARVEGWLAEHARGLRRDAEEAEREVLGAADRISETGRVPRPAAGDREGHEELLPWAAELAAVVAATAGDLARIAERAAADHAAARDALESGRELADRRNRHARAEERAAALRGQAGERAALGEEMAAAERAARVAPVLRTLEARFRQAEKTGLVAAERLALAGELLAPLAEESGGKEEARLHAGERLRRDEIAQLEHLRGDAEHMRRLREEAAELDREIESLRAAHEAVTGRREAYPRRRAALEAELETARAGAAAAEAARNALEAARRRLAACEEAERLAAELAEAERKRLGAVDDAQAAREELLEVRRRRLEGMAAELAARLSPGSPCPVCGSAEHPRPASAAETAAAEEEESARAADEAAQEHRLAAEQAATVLRGRLKAAEAAGEGADRAAAAEQVHAKESEVAAAAEAAAEQERLGAELAEAASAEEHDRHEESGLARRLSEHRERRAAREAEAERIQEHVDRARGEDPDLGARIARLETEAEVLAGAAEAVRQRENARSELATARAEAARELEEAGFSDADAAWAAHRPEERQRELREQARRHDDELAQVTAVLGDPELVAAAAREAPDLGGLQRAYEAAEETARRGAAWQERVALRGERLAELRDELADRLAESRPARERHRVSEGLARLAAGTSGANTEHVPLAAFVLASRLARVVDAANERLGTMAGGRYRLRHTVDRGAGDRSRSGGGLGLRVVDAWTGRERDPATLSGGETFVVSLALALGLGDVAGAEAGGGDIATLFIDEGFGTLDEDTLEEVLTVLDGLRDGGRAVGVVSHVAELRARVTARLSVRKTPAGSRLETNILR